MKKAKHKRMMDGGMATMGRRVLPVAAIGRGRPVMVRPGVPTGPVRTLPVRGSGPTDGGPMPVSGGMGGTKVPRPIPTGSVYQQTLGSNGNVVTMKHGGKVKSKAMRGGGLARKGVGMALRGGGLARKGVGMALAKGGLAKRAGGIAKRGVGRGKMC